MSQTPLMIGLVANIHLMGQRGRLYPDG